MNEINDSYESEEEVETTDTSTEGATIRLDPSLLQNQTATYHSLTDLHGIPLFTPTSQTAIASATHRAEQERQMLESLVFQTQLQAINDNEQLRSMLFQEHVTQIRVRDEEVTIAEAFPHLYPLFGLLFLLFIIVLIKYTKHRNEKIEQMKSDWNVNTFVDKN